MYGVLGMICMCLCGTSSPGILNPNQTHHPIELVSTEFEKIPDGELATSKRIAPQPAIAEFVSDVLNTSEPPPPALPVATESKIATAKVVVDEILRSRPTTNIATQSSDATVVQPRHDVDEVIESTSEEAHVVDIAQSNSNLFVVPDPTDDQFLTNPQPISIDFQEQLEQIKPQVETGVEEVVDSAETSTEQLTPSEETPNTVVPEDVVESETISITTDDEVVVETPVVEDAVVDSKVVDSKIVEQPVIETPVENQLIEVKQSWTSLNESTRQAILMLVEADLLTHQLTTQQ